MQEINNLMVRVTENLALQRPESKQLKTFDEERFLDSMVQKRIKDSTVEEIKQPLRYAMLKVGLRAQNYPTEEEKQLLIGHIIQEFGNNTLDEVRLAFDLLIGEKLDLEQSERTCYESFSCIYLSKVMNSYRRWASETYEQLIPKTPPTMLLECKEDTSDQAMQQWLDSIVQSGMRFEFLPIMIYDWLEKSGKVNKTAKEKKDYIRLAIPIRHAQISKLISEDHKQMHVMHKFNEMKEKQVFTGEEVEKMRNIAKRIILKEYIDELSGRPVV